MQQKKDNRQRKAKNNDKLRCVCPAQQMTRKPNNHDDDSFKKLIQFNSIINEHRPTTSETQPRVDRRNIETAQVVIERSLSPIREDLRQGSQQLSKQDLKAFEYQALLDWAKETEFLFSFPKFSQNWSNQGERRGREHFVYFDEPLNRWIKKNILTYHSTYGEYFQRLHLHNQIFPESPYDLIGFIQENDNLFPVVSQQDIKSIRGAIVKAVVDYNRRQRTAQWIEKYSGKCEQMMTLKELATMRESD